ncbi:unnamed protein product, partial [Porites lobata]
NKVFLGCPKKLEARCNFFQWIHEAPKPAYKPKTATRSALKKRLNHMVRSRTWLQQAEQNVEQWKKQQTEQAWLNQFAESTHKQNERWEAKKKVPVLPSTFHWSPEIAKIYKKTDGWKEV